MHSTRAASALGMSLASLFVLLVAGGCGGGNVPTSSGTSVARVTVAPTADTIAVGSGRQLTATTTDASGIMLTGRTVTWSSSDTTRAKVSTARLVSAVAVGTATMTATSEGRSGTANIVVNPVPVASVTVTPTPDTIVVGNTLQLTPTTKDAGGNVLTGRTTVWTTSDTSIAVVSASGLVTAIQPGVATVNATAENKVGSVSVYVTTPAFYALGNVPSVENYLVKVNPSDGSQQPVGPGGLPFGMRGGCIAIDGRGLRLFYVDFAGKLVTVNIATGAQLGYVSLAEPVIAIAYDIRTNTLYGLGNTPGVENHLLRLDVSTGITTPVGPGGLPFGISVGVAAIDARESRLFYKDASGKLVTVSLTSGTLVGVVTLQDNVIGLEYDYVGNALFGLGNTPFAENRLLSVNPSSGAVTKIGAGGLPYGLSSAALALDPVRGRLIFIGVDGKLTIVNSQTGAFVRAVSISGNILALR